MNNIRILHISDAHISDRNASTIANRVIALCQFLESEKLQPNIIVFTGDAAERGLQNEYKLFADKFIVPLLNNLSISASNFIIVPGNHDVDRNRIDPLTQAGLASFLSRPEEMDEFWRKTEQRQRFLKRQEPFFEFAKACKIQFETGLIDVNGFSVGIACINSAWLSSSDQDKNNLAISRAQIDEAHQLIVHADLRIALWHHPLHWLQENDASRIKEQILQKFSMLLTGHLHDQDGISVASPDGQTQMYTCPAFYAKGEDAGALYYDIDIQQRKLVSYAFRWNDKKAVFVYNTDFAKDGQWETTLAGGSLALSQQALSVRHKAIEKHQTKFSARLSRCLPPIVIGKRELSIDERFLDPHIVTIAIPKEKSVKFQEIIQSKSNFIINGLPQSGKTALLDRIGLKLNELGVFAVTVEFGDITLEENGRKGLISLLSTSLGCSKSDVKRILEGPITLLVDNCNLKYHLPEWNQLVSWQAECSSLRIIAAGRESVLPQPPQILDKTWKFLTLRPLPVALVKKAVERLERITVENIQPQSNIHTTVSTLIEAELPRWPWVILLLFELSQKFRISDVRSIEGVLRKYSDHRLGTFEAAGTDRSAIRARMLRLLATEMIESQTKSASRDEIVNKFDAELKASGQEENGTEIIRGTEILQELLDSQLLSENQDGIYFTFFILQEFFHAEHLHQTLWQDMTELDIGGIIRKSGALVFFGEKVQLPALLGRCLELTQSVRGSASVSNLIESLANLELPPIDAEATISAATKAIATEDELERSIENAETAQKGSRERRALCKSNTMEPLEQFIHSFSTSVAVLRGSRWLSQSLKQTSIDQILDLAMSIVAEISTDKNLLNAIASQGFENEMRRNVAAIINAMLVIVVSNMLAVLGAGKHLTITLREMFNCEVDDLRKLMLLMWYTEIGGSGLEEMVKNLARNANHTFTIRLAYCWLFSRFVTVKSYGTASAGDAEKLLRIVAEEQVRRHSDNRKPSAEIKAEAERSVGAARAARLLHHSE